MPGLCAIVQPAPSRVEPDLRLQGMLRRMSHYPWFRTVVHTDQGEGISLGAVTLEIARSPALARSGRTALVLDGELYESARERRRLESGGVVFASDGDAELLLKGWQAEGAGFLARLHGLFAALVWDGATRELTLLTDRFGLRPLYFAQTPGVFLVASEIKALLVHPGIDRSWSEMGVAQFFAFGHFLGDDTLYRGIRALPPATCAVYRANDDRFEDRRYAPAPRQTRGDRKALVRDLDDALVAAVGRRAAEGERLGLSLSGGLDARTLLGLMPRAVNLKSVSLGIEGSIDHRGATELARLVGVPHLCYCLDESFLKTFERHLRSMILLTDGHYLDQGIVMPTLPKYRELDIEILLRGHGGELLHMHKAYAFSLDERALRSSEDELETWLFAHLTGYMLQGVPADLFSIDVPSAAKASLQAALGRTTPVDRPVDRVWQLFLNERLHRETALSMHKFGCFATVRLPYLDNEVVDTLMTMPAPMKLGDALQTEILRHRRPEFLAVVNSNTGARVGASPLANYVSGWRLRIAAKLGVRGYQPYERLGLWLREDLRPLTEGLLLSDEFVARGLFRPDAVRRVVAQHMARQANHTFLIMSLVIFELGQRMLADPERFARELNE
jgi:asparagine synthase (glutamine-hydrolysing)